MRAGFLDMLYTNMMSTLKPGKCRYGLMCSENGFLIDDGVVARLGRTRSCAIRQRAAPTGSTAIWKNGSRPNGGTWRCTSET